MNRTTENTSFSNRGPGFSGDADLIILNDWIVHRETCLEVIFKTVLKQFIVVNLVQADGNHYNFSFKC